MKIQLSEHFTYGKLLRFVLPSIVMMTFSSVYSIVDGFFVSNYVGKTPFAAINLIYPFWMVLGALGFMMGTGGAAIVGKTLGEGDHEKAKRYFSLIVYVTFGIGIVVGTLGFLTVPTVAKLLGAEGILLKNCILYGRIVLSCLPFYMLQYLFQSFCVTAERPKLGLLFTAIAGCSNIVFDTLFIAVFNWGARRCGTCYRYRTDSRRAAASSLFCQKKFQSSANYKNAVLRQSSAQDLHQRFL